MMNDPVLEYSPFPAVGQKRQAEETESASSTKHTKRPASKKNALSESNSDAAPVPSMSKEDADKVLKSLVLPKDPKKQSQYVRFKCIMLKDAKAREDAETAKGITNAAKIAWNQVKNRHINVELLEPSIVPPTSSDANSETKGTASKIDRFLHFKRQAILEEKNEANTYQEQLTKFKSEYLEASIAFMCWKTRKISKLNFKAFETEVETIHSKVIAAWGSTLPTKFQEAYDYSMDKLNNIKKEVTIESLVKQLSNAPRELLLKHAQEHYALQEQVDKLNKIEEKAKVLQDEKEQAEIKAISSAANIKSEICRELKKQMVYTNSSLKYSPKKISYSRSGVSLKVFAAAFGVPEGTKKITFDGYEVGEKPLRYSSLSCGNVTVTLNGEKMTASSSYSL